MKEFNTPLFQVTDGKAKITSFESSAQRQRTELNGKSLEKMPVQLIHPTNEDESGICFTYKLFGINLNFLDSDEPLLSGSGTVNQECDEDVLKAYEDIIEKWKQHLDRCVPTHFSRDNLIRPQFICSLIFSFQPPSRTGILYPDRSSRCRSRSNLDFAGKSLQR